MTYDAADLDVSTAGRLLRERRLRAVDLAHACLERIDALDARLHAFITVTREEALATAAEADAALARGDDRGPLHGIPISLKDLIDQRGVPTTAASRAIDPVPVAADAPITRALRAAGAVLVGKTNLHEFALGTTSDETAFGTVHHPAAFDRSPGGSSGGSAVAVATGMSLASIGTDTGGSIRIPSAACGLVGLKPASGEVPLDGVVPLSRTLDCAGPIARTARDAALVYAALVGAKGLPPQPRTLDGCRFGVLGGYFTARLEPAVGTAFEAACRSLEQAGARLEAVEIEHAAAMPAIYLGILFPEAAAYHAPALDSRGDRYSPGVRARFEAARYVLGEDYARALRGREIIRAEVDRALEGRDALLAPSLAILAPPIGAATIQIDDVAEPVRNLMLRLTQPFNISGHPAITVPTGVASVRLPCGLQIVGHRGRTADLLAVAMGVEDRV